MSLPWDRFEPEASVEPLLPSPPAPLPVPVPRPPTPPPPVDVSPIADAITDALRQAARQGADYAWQSIQATGRGQYVDHSRPTVTVADMTGKELVVADAKSRSWRTLAQGLIFDVFAAIIAAVAMLSGADPFVKETWIAFGVLLVKSVVAAIISYFMRLRVTPTIRTEGQKFAIAPVPRPMVDEERKTA